MRKHEYEVAVEWAGSATTEYAAYSRDHVISAGGRPALPGSSDVAFRGDGARWSPELLMLGAISACHQLWYLHLCAEAGVVVVAYRDAARAVMREHDDGSGEFAEAVLAPDVVIAAGDVDMAMGLHAAAAAKCFIARSVNFPVRHDARVRTA